MIFIRVDANELVGMGHVIRCLSIADAFSSMNEEVMFVTSDDKCCHIINARGFKAVVLNSDYTKMDDESNWLVSSSQDIVIVDSYYVTQLYLTRLHDRTRATGGTLVYIDDLYSFPYPVDILINYNAYSSEERYNALYNDTDTDKPKFVLGPSFAPLRSMFRGIEKKEQSQKVYNVLISTGGSDELHLTLSLIEYLVNQKSEREYVYNFLIGALNSDKTAIRSLAQGQDRIVLFENVTDMKSLIRNMDVVISAAGFTLYEVCSCGVPLVIYSLADNQIPGAEAFERLGLGITIGDLRDSKGINKSSIMGGILKENAASLLFSGLDKLAENYRLRFEMGKTMQHLIDGYGADRLARRILKEKDKTIVRRLRHTVNMNSH